MHNDRKYKVKSALNRLIAKIDVSLYSGFASFFTTHENLINTLTTINYNKNPTLLDNNPIS